MRGSYTPSRRSKGVREGIRVRRRGGLARLIRARAEE
jgi:hypothetical protein